MQHRFLSGMIESEARLTKMATRVRLRRCSKTERGVAFELKKDDGESDLTGKEKAAAPGATAFFG
jgi:hypothetical protein